MKNQLDEKKSTYKKGVLKMILKITNWMFFSFLLILFIAYTYCYNTGLLSSFNHYVFDISQYTTLLYVVGSMIAVSVLSLVVIFIYLFIKELKKRKIEQTQKK